MGVFGIDDFLNLILENERFVNGLDLMSLYFRKLHYYYNEIQT